MSKSLKIIMVAFFFTATLGTIIKSGIFNSDKNNSGPMLTFSEFDEVIQLPITTISAIELAEFLFTQEHHYNLIDLQSPSHIKEDGYQIPSADKHNFDTFLKLKIKILWNIHLICKV